MSGDVEKLGIGDQCQRQGIGSVKWLRSNFYFFLCSSKILKIEASRTTISVLHFSQVSEPRKEVEKNDDMDGIWEGCCDEQGKSVL